MVSPTPQISASLVNTPPSEIPFDKGVVETRIDASTYIIRLPFEDITVRVPPGSLTVGDSVSIACHGDEVSIAINSLALESLSVLDDSLELRIGPDMTELLTLLKDLQSTVPLNQGSTVLTNLLTQAIEFLEQKHHDISSLILLLSQLKQELFHYLDTTLPSGTREATQRITELLDGLARNLSGYTGAGEELQTRVVTVSQAPQRGLYYVKGTDEALALLTHYSPESEHDAREVLKAYTGKPLFILFYESAAGAKKAMVMPQEQALLEIEHILRAEMKSEIMRQLDPKLIADIVMHKGNLTLSHLVDLDALLESVSAKDQASLLQGDALSMSLPQLVAVALDAGDTRIPDFHTALMLIGSRIPDLVQDIVTWLETNRDNVKLSDCKNILLNGFSADQFLAAHKEEALPSLFRNAGFSLEHDLYGVTSDQATAMPGVEKDSPSLKLALLIILGYCNTLAEGTETKEEGIREGSQTIRSDQAPIVDTAKASLQERAGTPRDGTALPRMANEVVRQQVETVLNRLESLQMLAKPVVSAEGEQQVLVLPVRVDDEWTEVRVKFVKKRSTKKKGKSPEHITVLLNMALTRLGELSAFLEYYTKKSLQVSLTLENALAREWFAEHKKEVQEALLAVGIPAVQLHVLDKNIRKEKKSFTLRTQVKPKSNFDVIG